MVQYLCLGELLVRYEPLLVGRKHNAVVLGAQGLAMTLRSLLNYNPV